MKKIISILLTLTLILSIFALTSCNDDKVENKDEAPKTVEKLAGKTPTELYAYAQELLAEATSFSVEGTQVITMQAGNQTMTINQIVISKVSGEDTYMKSENDMTPDANMEVWYVDGMLYSAYMGAKLKAPMDKQAFMEEYMDVDPSESTLLDIPASWFEDIKFEEDGDKWVLRFEVSGEKYTQVFQNTGIGGTIVGDVTHKLYFDENGNLGEIVTDFDMNMSGVDAHCVSRSTITIEPITISPPADADTYTPAVIQ